MNVVPFQCICEVIKAKLAHRHPASVVDGDWIRRDRVGKQCPVMPSFCGSGGEGGRRRVATRKEEGKKGGGGEEEEQQPE